MTFPDILQVTAESGVRTMQFLVQQEKELQEIREYLGVKRTAQVAGHKLISIEPQVKDADKAN